MLSILINQSLKYPQRHVMLFKGKTYTLHHIYTTEFDAATRKCCSPSLIYWYIERPIWCMSDVLLPLLHIAWQVWYQWQAWCCVSRIIIGYYHGPFATDKRTYCNFHYHVVGPVDQWLLISLLTVGFAACVTLLQTTYLNCQMCNMVLLCDYLFTWCCLWLFVYI